MNYSKPRWFILGLAFGVALLAQGCQPSEDRGHPDVLLGIVVDLTGWRDAEWGKGVFSFIADTIIPRLGERSAVAIYAIRKRGYCSGSQEILLPLEPLPAWRKGKSYDGEFYGARQRLQEKVAALEQTAVHDGEKGTDIYGPVAHALDNLTRYQGQHPELRPWLLIFSDLDDTVQRQVTWPRLNGWEVRLLGVPVIPGRQRESQERIQRWQRLFEGLGAQVKDYEAEVTRAFSFPDVALHSQGNEDTPDGASEDRE
jgi:hypothetical protein